MCAVCYVAGQCIFYNRIYGLTLQLIVQEFKFFSGGREERSLLKPLLSLPFLFLHYKSE